MRFMDEYPHWDMVILPDLCAALITISLQLRYFYEPARG